jgi:hypothetical protein
VEEADCAPRNTLAVRQDGLTLPVDGSVLYRLRRRGAGRARLARHQPSGSASRVETMYRAMTDVLSRSPNVEDGSEGGTTR